MDNLHGEDGGHGETLELGLLMRFESLIDWR
jgi:hypothetical protein